MKILFVGCVKSSLELLCALLDENYTVVGVITKQSSPFNSDFCDLTSICKLNDIPFIQFEGKCWENAIGFATTCAPDVLYCFGFSHLLPPELLQIPVLGAVGFHPARLPFNRGRHPLIWALALGLKSTASSFFMLEATADAGDIVSQVEVSINPTDDAGTLYRKVMECATKQVIMLTQQFLNGTVSRTSQKGVPSNSWRKRDFRDGVIDFRMSGSSICNLVRALAAPYPGACFCYQGNYYSVWRAQTLSETTENLENIEPGKVLSVESPSCFTVRVSDGILKILEASPIELQEGDYLR